VLLNGFRVVSVADNRRVGEASPSQSTDTAAVAVPGPSQTAVRYYHSGNVLWVIDTGIGLLLPALLLFSGFSSRLRTVAHKIGKRWLPAVAVYALLFTIVSSLLALPLAWYAGYARQHEYGLSHQSLERWLGEWGKGVAVSAIGLSIVLWIPYLLLRRSPRWWWLYTGVASLPLATLLLVVTPVWVDPLFNRFEPMHDKALEARVLALAKRAGIEGSRVYEVDKSADTKTVNAYVTGFAGTKRIVLWDTLLEKLTADQILFVMAHEMGHFVLHHTLAVILAISVFATASLYAVHRLAGKLIVRFRHRFGFQELSDVASFPLLLLLGGMVSFVLTPAALALSRYQEHEADRFALELTRANRTAALTFIRLQEENLTVPRPGLLYLIWRGSHPPLGNRIDFANEYHPWTTGQKVRYERLFREGE
jgi:STE24 endopeptidase